MRWKWLLCLACLFSGSILAQDYEIRYRVTVAPASGVAQVEIKLRGERLPSRLAFAMDPDRYLHVTSKQPLELDERGRTVWRPVAPLASLRYDFVVDEKKDGDSYDSLMVEDWAVLRSDKLIPSLAATAPGGLESRAELILQLPDDWSAAAPYEELEPNGATVRYRLLDPGRSFIRPKGWMILGKIASRQDVVAGVEVRVAAPRGQQVRLLDTLTFLSWTLPQVKAIFGTFPARLLIVSAADPMWRGGLSGTRSLFMHADRPLVSGNRTSSLIHELIHVGTGIRGDSRSDWIVEGLAEYYAVEILHRTGGISEERFQQTLEELAAWGEVSDQLLTGDSSGATTARAVGIMVEVDREIRRVTDDRASLDDVAAALAAQRGEVTVKGFIDLAEGIAGKKLSALSGLVH
ncbi:MAG: hypothetical protein KDI01_00730 [Halioglobus sp.]|nr:hypothetical protein [Halioglobus sp.]